MSKEIFICEGKIKSFDNPNGTKTIAVISQRDWVGIALNYRHREDEKDRIWWNDSIWWDLEKNPPREPSRDEIMQLTNEIIKQSEKITKIEIDFDKCFLHFEETVEVDDRPLTF